MDLSAVEAGNGEVATVVFALGDALGDALVRPGRWTARTAGLTSAIPWMLNGTSSATFGIGRPRWPSRTGR
jgi:hypothetical protein